MAEGRYDISLSHSGCQSRSVNELIDERQLIEFGSVSLNYGAFDGLAELRSRIAQSYRDISGNDVVTLNGPSEAIYTFMRAVLTPGDRVVVQAPLCSVTSSDCPVASGAALRSGGHSIRWSAAFTSMTLNYFASNR